MESCTCCQLCHRSGLPKSGLMSKILRSPTRFCLECLSKRFGFLFEPWLGFCYGSSDLCGCFHKWGNTGKSCGPSSRLLVTSSVALCSLYIEHGVTSAPLDTTASSADWHQSLRRSITNYTCLVCPSGRHRLLRRDGDSSRQPESVRQHRRLAGLRGGSAPADRL